MAVIKNGKIHGKIGNYIYRVVNGTEIIQSYPSRVKISQTTKLQNEKFAQNSRMNSKIYRLIKDFALSEIDGKFYYALMGHLNQNFHSVRNVSEDASYNDWTMLPRVENNPINYNLRVEEVLRALPIVEINEDACIIQVPEYTHRRTRWSFIEDANYIEYTVSVIHYDFDQEVALPLCDWDSGRFALTAGFPENKIKIPLIVNDQAIECGLLIVCLGIRFFASSESYGYLNTKACNPTSILGIAYKRGGSK